MESSYGTSAFSGRLAFQRDGPIRTGQFSVPLVSFLEESFMILERQSRPDVLIAPLAY